MKYHKPDINKTLLRPNYKPLTSPNELVYSTSLPFYGYYARSGNVYTVSTGSLTISANGYLVVQLTNPANSGRTIYINRISGGATTNTTFDILKNATFSAAGTPLTPTNTNWSYADTSAITGKYLSQSPDPTTGGTLMMSIIQVGGPVVLDFDGMYIMPSSTTNREFYIRLINNANQVNILSVNINWWEL